jgi:hypothetical protein
VFLFEMEEPLVTLTDGEAVLAGLVYFEGSDGGQLGLVEPVELLLLEDGWSCFAEDGGGAVGGFEGKDDMNGFEGLFEALGGELSFFELAEGIVPV